MTGHHEDFEVPFYSLRSPALLISEFVSWSFLRIRREARGPQVGSVATLSRCALSPLISPNTITQIERLTPDMGFFIKKLLFPLGKLLIAEAVNALDYDIHRVLKRHQSGDFGCVDQYDVDQNHHAIECGDAILSQYHVMVDEKKILICVMTEGDRSYTVLFIVDQKKPISPDAPEDGNNQSPE